LDLAHDAGRPVALRGCTLAELRSSAAFWTSSLSGAVPVASVDGVPLPRRDAEVAALAAALLMS
jgi:branched-subunit amino acid aminotransferase/4-amino-4-deoxychorismate lyase